MLSLHILYKGNLVFVGFCNGTSIESSDEYYRHPQLDCEDYIRCSSGGESALLSCPVGWQYEPHTGLCSLQCKPKGR